MGRAPCCDKTNVKRGPWSPEEDAKLKAYIEQNGTGGNWIALPQKIGLRRCGKSCRLRWLNYLRPNIKHGGFSEEEDNIICSLYISIGSRWSIIAAQLPGRTDNDIKNYWNTRLKKKILGRGKDSRTHWLIKEDDGLNDLSSVVSQTGMQPLSSSALERMQLHMQLQSLQNPYSIINPLSSFNIVGNQPSVDANLPMVQNHLVETHNAKGLESLSANSGEHNHAEVVTESKECCFNELSSSGVAAHHGSFSSSSQDVAQSLKTIESFPAQFQEVIHSNHEPLGRFDSLKEVDGNYGGMIWWGNDNDQKTMNSWDSSCGLQHEAFSFQDLGLEYGLL